MRVGGLVCGGVYVRKYKQRAAAATHRATLAHREDRNRVLGRDRAPTAASICGHFDFMSGLH